MNTLIKPAILAGLLVPATAFAGLELGQPLGTTEEGIRAALTDMGYTVEEFEAEEGEIEVDVTLDGVAYEVEVAADTGHIIAMELEDDEDGDDD
ncbi:PepSY domain-containing protein [uncultured Tateyamaria sp.]|uniref:PepSY domain-containing protein n=1 Tax=Tateyamaria sp. 1078 TaxID=3417464 RepID=UPI00261C9224|nr:PepSY domain-containing protein [uncultured Tateyamaria sp.]